MLIICSECGKEYSDQAKSCPHCGALTSKNRYIPRNQYNQFSPNNNTGSNTASGLTALLAIIIAIVLGFIGIKLFFGVLGFLGLNNDDIKSTAKHIWDSSFSDNGSSTKSSNYSSNKVYNIGDKITTNKFEITVLDVKERSSVGSTFVKESAGEGNTFVCVRVKIKNISNKPINTFQQPSFYLIDGKDVTYYTDASASIAYTTEVDDTTNALSDLNPGVTVYDSGVFELGKSFYLLNSIKLKISADTTVLVRVK